MTHNLNFMPDGKLSIPALRYHIGHFLASKGHFPTKKEHFKVRYLPKYDTIIRHFGSIEQMYEILDIK